jgi:DNA polymerase-3 subunit gamma/tau
MADAPFVSLYRRFRPNRFEELRGQDHVVRALQSAVRDERVSHAYLFSGPRGTGKTSSARILAKALNCEAPLDGEPCGKCISCTEITLGTSLNVHELDAASNNGVDAMRDLVAHAGLGTPGRWKVYIVDEVHMLSTPAANALLKTLEEPPSHVVFVLATTDPQKVPPTIRSRTQHLEFRLLGADTLQGLLESVKAEAGFAIDDESVQAAVRRARGSARDALSALDQMAAAGSSDSARPELTSALIALSESDVSGVLVAVSGLLAGGWGPQQLAVELVDDLRQVFLAALAPTLCSVSGSARERFTEMAKTMGLARVVRTMEVVGQAMVDMRDAPDAQVVLEIAMVRATRPDLDSGIEALSDRVSKLERSLTLGGQSLGGVTEPEQAVPSRKPVPTLSAQGKVGQRPSLGAYRRRPDSTPIGEDSEGMARNPEKPRDTEVTPPPSTQLSEGDHSESTVDRDSLSEAWGDGILRSLPARVKALYSAGHFVAVDAQGAKFALPTAPHRDRCVELVPLVEAALSDRFGQPVKLVLVVAGPSSASPPRQKATSGESVLTSGPHADGGDELDPVEFHEANEMNADQASDAEARLLQAFPGASEVVN